MVALSGERGAREELRAAIGLAGVEGVGATTYRRLVDRFGSAVEVLRRAGKDPVLGRTPAGRRLRERIARVRPVGGDRLRALGDRGIRAVAYGETGYPDTLDHLHDPPPVLYLRGPLPLRCERTVAVVGTRTATGYGRRMARDLGADLALGGWRVASGLARGVDRAAHEAVLEAEGEAIGVLGCGLDHVAPPSSRRLYRRISEVGLLVSEFAPETPPEPAFFPRRNRILAALSRGVVVVQAGRRSGALITADLALDLGREVFGVPGPVGPPGSVGVHRLLRQGAAVATCGADVRDVLEPSWRSSGAGTGTGTRRGPEGETSMLAHLRGEPRSVDELARATGLAPGATAALLTRLELDGRVRVLPGGRYEVPRRASATEGERETP